jgi:predicted metal-dependent peptidase
MNKIQQARARMLLGQVFFATLLLSVPYKPSRLNATAWTDMTQIGYNPEFFETLDVDTIAFVFAHEVAHIALKHGLRRGSRNPDRWNRACDYFINLWLQKAGFKVWQHALLDARFDGMSSEQIYDKLQQEEQANPDQPQPRDGLHGDVQAPGSMGGEDGGDGPSGGLSADAIAKIEQTIQQNIAAAANHARLAGQMSGDLERRVDGLLNPQAPWETLLQEFMRSCVADEETWARRNRRFADIYLPTRYSERLGDIVWIGDTSGSISGDELVRQASEVAYVCEVMRPERLRLLWADTAVAGEQVFEQGDPFTPEPQGGGGTDMRVPLGYATQFDPDVVVLSTDGYTPWPDAPPPFPLIVCCTTDADVPDYATVVRVR